VYVPRGAELLTAEGFTPPPDDAFEAIPSDAVPDRDLLATELHATVDPVTGVRITEEFGRTAFGGWMQLPSGAQRAVRISYRLPWRYSAQRIGALGRTVPADPQPYSLRIQKQPGTKPTIRHTLDLHPHWRATWTSENLHTLNAHTWMLEDILTTDRLTGAMIAPE
jgi:hypothetical protein